MLFVALTGFFIQKIPAQTYASIEKNVNNRASDLFHDLNKTKDTLLLKSNEKINYVYTINKDHKVELDYYVNANSFEVPLDNLSRGKHVVVVERSKMKIVFVVRVFGDTRTVLTTHDD